MYAYNVNVFCDCIIKPQYTKDIFALRIHTYRHDSDLRYGAYVHNIQKTCVLYVFIDVRTMKTWVTRMCIYEHVCVCMCARLLLTDNIPFFFKNNTHMHVHWCVCNWLGISIVYVSAWSDSLQLCVYIYIYIYIYIYAYIVKHPYNCLQYPYVFMFFPRLVDITYTHIHVHICMYMCIYTHTNVHTWEATRE